MNRTDVIIIGGGVSGLMCARELSAAGKRVTLVDRQAFGKESSWAGGGILSPLNPWRTAEPVTALCQWSQLAYPVLAEGLKESTGTDPEWLSSGLLFSDCMEIDRAKAWADTHGIRYETMDSEDLGQIEPNLCNQGENPLILPDIAQVRNPRLLRALIADLTKRGVAMRERHPVEQIKIEHEKAVGVIANGQLISADTVVVTAGAWSGLLACNSGLAELPVMPVKGEMLIYHAPPGLLRHMVLSGGRYLIPRKDGRILAGSTVENAYFNKSITDSAYEALSRFATTLLPALRQAPIEKHWAGLRPGSLNGIPFIGPHPEVANLYFNCGHFRNGFVMAPASARLLANHVLHQTPIVSPEPYLPATESCGSIAT